MVYRRQKKHMTPDSLAEHEVKDAIAGTLLKRLGRPENIAHAVVFVIENDYLLRPAQPRNRFNANQPAKSGWNSRILRWCYEHWQCRHQ
jgi:hypothetical protein